MPVFRQTAVRWATALLLIASNTSCTPATARRGGSDQQAIQAAAAGTQSARATTPDGSWQSLFDGRTIVGWHGFSTPGVIPAGWQAVDGAITRVGDGDDLVTDKVFGNFELTLEWRIAAKGNSGILYRIDPAATVTYESGPEMQVLDDDGHPDGKLRVTAAGSAFALYPAPLGAVKKVGEWNAIRLVVNGAHVEHWLNGVKTVEYELWSPDWLQRVQASKFKQWRNYGLAKRGYIGLQNHGDMVSFRSIRIRELL